VALPGRVTATKVYDRLVVTKKPSPSPIQGRFPVEIGLNLLEPFGIILECTVTETLPQSLPDDERTAFFDHDKTSALLVRTFLDGDRFVPLGMESGVKLKNFFISKKMPLHQRRQIPLLVSGEDIIWVLGQRIDERYKVTESTRRVLRVSIRPQL